MSCPGVGDEGVSGRDVGPLVCDTQRVAQADEHVPAMNRSDGCRSRILEIGVGEGVVAQRTIEPFPSASLLGLDLPDDELAGHWADRDLGGLVGDATALPFPDDTFDWGVAIEVFERLPDIRHADAPAPWQRGLNWFVFAVSVAVVSRVASIGADLIGATLSVPVGRTSLPIAPNDPGPAGRYAAP